MSVHSLIPLLMPWSTSITSTVKLHSGDMLLTAPFSHPVSLLLFLCGSLPQAVKCMDIQGKLHISSFQKIFPFRLTCTTEFAPVVHTHRNGLPKDFISQVSGLYLFPNSKLLQYPTSAHRMFQLACHPTENILVPPRALFIVLFTKKK